MPHIDVLFAIETATFMAIENQCPELLEALLAVGMIPWQPYSLLADKGIVGRTPVEHAARIGWTEGLAQMRALH